MNGSFRQRGATSWELRVYAGVDPDTRRRRYRTATIHGSRADAQRALAALVADVRSHKSIGATSTMSELLEAWFAIAAVSWAPTTVRQTRSVLDRYLHPHLGGYRVGEITTAMIDATYTTLGTRGSLAGTALKPGTLARVHVVVRSAFAQAQRWGWVWDNPAERAHRIVAAPVELHPPTPSEVAALLRHLAVTDPRFHVFVLLAATTGARPRNAITETGRPVRAGRIASLTPLRATRPRTRDRTVRQRRIWPQLACRMSLRLETTRANRRSTTGRIPTMKVTEKGQVTIPKELRDALGIGAGTEVEFERRKDTIVVRKSTSAPSRGRRLAERLRGGGDVAMTTDEIMALTRGA